jgi:acid phosphatase type 7
MKMITIKRYLLILATLLLAACMSTREGTVQDLVDKVVTDLYETKSRQELASLTHTQVMGLFNEEELKVLGTRHWMFDVNVPVVVSVIRSTGQETIPFWLPERGFVRTDMVLRNTSSEYEIWQKSFDAGRVGLGINGFENSLLHYFVSVGPQNKGDELVLSNFFPENQYIGITEDGQFTYHDWTGLVISDVPEELQGQKLLTTIRGRGVESHLVGAFRETDFPSSDRPDQVMLTWSSDTSTGIDIQWRTDTSVKEGIVEYREKGSGEIFTREAEVYMMEDLRLMNDRFIHRHTARLRDLKPGTVYEYQIPPGTGWDEKYTFTTGDTGDSFSFIWFGDAHNSPLFGELHNKAEASHPDAAFYSIAGDLVGDGLYRNHWDDLFGFSENIISRKPLMTVPGNHDNRLGLGAKMFRDMFSYPSNGPEGVPEGQAYSFTYKNALFLMLDSTSPLEPQTEWIEEQLSNTSATWKFAIFHFPPYNFSSPYTRIQEEWVPVFDKYHVDMVFGGHIHYYMRSNPMRGGEVVDSFNDGTVYVISIGIPSRDRPMAAEPYAAVRGTGQYYQYLKINGNELEYSAIDSNNKIIDSFRIKK